MMLDNHQIVIRERGCLELLDLSLRALRSQAGPFFLALLAGVGPLVVLNAWLLNRFAAVPEGSGPPWPFLGLMLTAVLWELPLATAPATVCLGRALFNQPLEAGRMARELAQSLPQLIFYQVLLRGLLMATVAGSFVPFVINPYLNEVILLERNPFQEEGKGSISTWRRSALLHRGQDSGFATGWVLGVVAGTVLVATFWGSMAVAASWLLNEPQWAGPFYTCLYPAALWMVVAYFTVVRFLGYLDLRIRSEGWEVELLMRAERARWKRIPQAS